ncbi:MAG: hypothetical protein J6C97_03035 [Clostridia bacterium]|nr:hypothetical protein [Clostridia bacterium]
MKISEYVNILKKAYKAKVIVFENVRNYFSTPNMYGKTFDVYYVSERIIESNNFKTIIIKGSNVDPSGKYDYGTKAIIIFAEYDENEEVIHSCVISSFFLKDKLAQKRFYDLLTCYRKN